MAQRQDGASVGEFARVLGVSKSTVYALCESGELPHLRVSNAIRIPEEWGAMYLREKAARGGKKSSRPK